jgi:sugar lactone lactonase YvrE
MIKRLSLAGLLVAIGIVQAQSLPPCTGVDFTVQETQSNCMVTPNPGGSAVITTAFTNAPTFLNTPVSQSVNRYQTTLIAVTNGVTVFQQTYAVAFSDPSVQSAISQADAVLTSDGATFGSPALTSTSTALQSSILSYVPTSPTLDFSTLIGCTEFGIISTATCSGVTVTNTAEPATVTFGPATIMVGPNYSDQFFVLAGQEDTNVDHDFTYTVTQNAVTTNTYLTTQTYVIQGTGGVVYSPCDVNRDGKTNVLDVQAMVKEGLGTASAANDVNGDGVVNVVDVQIVLNGVLTLGCTVAVGARPVESPHSVIVRQDRPVSGIFVVAGNGSPGYNGDGGPATSAEIMNPAGIGVDRVGNLYIADAGNHRVRKVAVDGAISTVAGNGDAGYLNPLGAAVDAAGNLYIADAANHRIRKVGLGGAMSTVAGNGISGYSGDGGSATEAGLNYPSGIAVDAAGNLYIADTYNQSIRKVAVDGTISTVAGNGNAAYAGDGGPAVEASLYDPVGVAVDVGGNVYIADSGNLRVRKIGGDGRISTVAGNGDAGYLHPTGIAVDAAGSVYIADCRNHRIRRVAINGTISTVDVVLYGASGVALDAVGNLFVADTYGQAVHEITGPGR